MMELLSSQMLNKLIRADQSCTYLYNETIAGSQCTIQDRIRLHMH